MKTTIELPDALAEDAKHLARAQGVTLRELVVTGLRHEVDRRRGAPTSPDFHFPTFAGTGLQVDPEDAITISYGLQP